MTTLAEACAELATRLPQAAQLITEPDTQPSAARSKPGSAPPWNAQAANAYFDAHAMVRDTERLLRFLVTGGSGQSRPWTDAALRRSLSAIERLGTAVPQADADRAARALTAAATVILQLPAIDEAERPMRVRSACPYCHFAMLRVFPRSGRVACLRAMAGCTDSDGQPPEGTLGRSQLDGTPRITWKDGLVT